MSLVGGGSIEAEEYQRPAAVIFDFDGVLIDSMELHIQAWVAATASLFGVTLENPNRLRGHATIAIAAAICQQLNRPPFQAALIAEKQRILLESRHLAPLLPGARELVKALASAQIPLAIASNAPRPFVDSTAERHGLPIDVRLGREDVQRGKPRPDIFLLAARKLGQTFDRHHEIIIFEDSCHGLKAATAAKMFAIGIQSQHDAETLRAAGARRCYANLADAHAGDPWFHALRAS